MYSTRMEGDEGKEEDNATKIKFMNSLQMYY